MFIGSVLSAAVVLGGTAFLMVRWARARRGEMVFQYPSGKTSPEFFNPLAWQELLG